MRSGRRGCECRSRWERRAPRTIHSQTVAPGGRSSLRMAPPLGPLAALLLLGPAAGRQLGPRDHGIHPNSVYSGLDLHRPREVRARQDLRTFYQTGDKDADLPVCSPYSVCSKLDTYGAPFLEKQCRCPGAPCPAATHARDGHTVHDRTKQFKLCEPVKKLKRCKFFRDVTWTKILYPDNSTAQVMHCRCPRSSVAYLVKRHAYQTEAGLGYQFSFACSPQTKLKCERKEPCRLFSVKKSAHRPEVDEVTTSSLCSCPHSRRCPQHHLDVGVVPGRTYSEDAVRAYSGYCM